MANHKIPFKTRFLIHLPTLDNNGKSIPLSVIEQAFKKLRRKFGAYTTSSYIGEPDFMGFYTDSKNVVYIDYIYLVYVDVEGGEPTRNAIKFFKKFREWCMRNFDQEDIYILYHKVAKVE